MDYVDTVQNYLVVLVKVGNKLLKALVDTGAQPTVIKRSCVPIGTFINESNLCIKGVQGPLIPVCGMANISMEVGAKILPINCVVVQDEAIEFPADTSIIMGVNLLAGNKVDVSTSKWALVYKNEPIKYLEPAYIDGNLLSPSEQDYATNAGLTSYSEPEFGRPTSSAEEDEELIRASNSLVRKKKGRFYPQDSPLRDDMEHAISTGTIINPNEWERYTESPVDVIHPEVETSNTLFSVTSEANISLRASSLNMIKIAIRDENGSPAPNGSQFEVEGGLIAPGIIALQGITNQRDTIAVINFNRDEFNMYRKVPFMKAEEINIEDIALIYKPEGKIDLFKPEVCALMALSAITEEAYVSEGEYSSDTEELTEALDFDPSAISTEEVCYNEERYLKLLGALKTDGWDLSRKQREEVEHMLSEN